MSLVPWRDDTKTSHRSEEEEHGGKTCPFAAISQHDHSSSSSKRGRPRGRKIPLRLSTNLDAGAPHSGKQLRGRQKLGSGVGGFGVGGRAAWSRFLSLRSHNHAE